MSEHKSIKTHYKDMRKEINEVVGIDEFENKLNNKTIDEILENWEDLVSIKDEN